MTLKIVTILGARPQFVKAAVVSRAIAKHNEENSAKKIDEVILHTGQHYDANMSDIFFKEMEIPNPKHFLEVANCSHGVMTGKMLEKIEPILVSEKPDVVLVYGDTNSTLAGALAASKLSIPIAHVEAGLRSYNRVMPEEINRVVADHLSSFLFCPSKVSKENLKTEGILNQDIGSFKRKVIVSGDVMYDAVKYYSSVGKPSDTTIELMEKFKDKEFFLATIHRQENTDSKEKLAEILEAFETISRDQPVVLALHPRTKKFLDLYGLKFRNTIVIDPVGYFDMLHLIQNSSGVLTDSGGLQKESYFLGKSCLVLREETEWTELIDENINFLAPPGSGTILKHFSKIKFANIRNRSIYGAGFAGDKIVSYLIGK